MSTIYIIVAAGGDYDSSWQENLSAFSDKKVAELEVLRLEEQTKRIGSMIDKVRTVYYDAIKHDTITLEQMPPMPKGPSKPNKENRLAHQQAMSAWQEISRPIAQRNEAKRLAQMDFGKAQALAKAIELGAVEDDLKVMGFEQDHFSPYCRDSDASYEIQEMELK